MNHVIIALSGLGIFLLEITIWVYFEKFTPKKDDAYLFGIVIGTAFSLIFIIIFG